MRNGFRCLLTAAAIVLLLPSVATAQSERHDVSGVVFDSSGTSLPSATVVALTSSDSTLYKFSTTRRDGTFTMRRLDAGSYILQITYVGFQTLYHDFEVVDGDVDVGKLTMKEQTVALDEFVISADRVPISVGRDTITYNAKAFGARPNEVAEDLLRRLPGIEVNQDGSIKAHGEVVQNVLVDGKEFFGSDPTIATKNLPAESVDKVKVYDKESDKAELTGVPDGNEEKTIDLELTEDAKSGYFGNISGGLGGENTHQGRYDVNGNLFRFSPKSQVSLLSSANNINRQGFGAGQLFSLVGSGALTSMGSGFFRNFAPGGTGGGFAQSLNAGLNVSYDLASKSNISTSYFASHYDASQDRTSYQQQVLGSGITALSNLTSNQKNENLRHTANLYAKLNFGTGHDMRIRGNLSAGTSSLARSSLENTTDPATAARLGIVSDFGEDTDNLDGNLSLVWRKRLSEDGPSLVVQGRANARRADALGQLNSLTSLQSLGDLQTDEELIQRQEELSNQLGHSQRLAYTHPLRGGLTLEAFGSHSTAGRSREKLFEDQVDSGWVRNDHLSDHFDQSERSLSTGVEMSYNPKEEVWITSGLTLQQSSITGTIMGRSEDVSGSYLHLLPWVRYRHSLSDSRRITLSYRSRMRTPSVTELQPFEDNSNPVRIYVGNPDLRPEATHSVNGAFHFYDQFSFVGFNTGFTLRLTQNDIVTTRTVDAQLRQVRSRVNADALSWAVTHRIGFETPVRPLGIAIDLTNSVNYQTGSEFINQAENTNRLLRNSVSLRVRNRTQDLVEAHAKMTVTYNSNQYSLNREANQQYVNSTIDGGLSWHVSDVFSLESDLVYRIFDKDAFSSQAVSRDFGRQENIFLLNLSASHLVLKERGEIRLEVRDVFNQNTGVTYNNAPTYVQAERVIAMGRYVMLRFIYRPRGKAKGGFLFGF